MYMHTHSIDSYVTIFYNDFDNTCIHTYIMYHFVWVDQREKHWYNWKVSLKRWDTTEMYPESGKVMNIITAYMFDPNVSHYTYNKLNNF